MRRTISTRIHWPTWLYCWCCCLSHPAIYQQIMSLRLVKVPPPSREQQQHSRTQTNPTTSRSVEMQNQPQQSRGLHVYLICLSLCLFHHVFVKPWNQNVTVTHHQPFQPPPSMGTKSIPYQPLHRGRSCLIERTIMTTIHMHGVARLWPSIFQHANQRAFDPLVGLGL